MALAGELTFFKYFPNLSEPCSDRERCASAVPGHQSNTF